MQTGLVQQTESSNMATLARRAKQRSIDSIPANTRRAFASDWAAFTTWCASEGVAALPATDDTVTAYAEHLAGRGLKVATIRRAFTTINKAHKTARVYSPTESAEVQEVLKGIVRTLGSASTRKAAATDGTVKAMVAALPDTLTGKRDRALILLGFAGALRRSELVAVHVEDVTFLPDGSADLYLPKSKTDQEGKGATLAIRRGSNGPDTCPVRSLRAWIDAAGITEGAVFRSVRRGGHVTADQLRSGSVAEIIKGAASAAGMEPEAYSGHSLRRGWITTVAKAGAIERSIMAHSRHIRVETCRAYIEDARRHDNEALGMTSL